jgi:hypothetical protein
VLATALALMLPACAAGEDAYRALELDAAAAAFALCDERATTDAERAQLAAWLGLTHAQQGALDVARDDFARAFAFDPDVALPAPASPKIERMFEDARPEPAAPPAPPPSVATPAPDVDHTVSFALFAAGGATAALAAVAGVLVGVHYSSALDPKTPQPEAQSLVNLANVELAAASALGVVGAALAAAGIVLWGGAADSA